MLYYKSYATIFITIGCFGFMFPIKPFLFFSMDGFFKSRLQYTVKIAYFYSSNKIKQGFFTGKIGKLNDLEYQPETFKYGFFLILFLNCSQITLFHNLQLTYKTETNNEIILFYHSIQNTTL